ncbi:hypothetical protein D3C81_773710 [compost metagenome]
MNYPTTVVTNGIRQFLFSVEFTTCDGVFSVPIYAVSFEHAQAIVEDLKATAVLGGRLHGVKR